MRALKPINEDRPQAIRTAVEQPADQPDHTQLLMKARTWVSTTAQSTRGIPFSTVSGLGSAA